MAEGKLTGVDKAAILLMNVGEDVAGEVFKHLAPDEIRLIGASIIKRDSVSMQVGKKVLSEFFQSIGSGEMAVEGLEYARNMITKALGNERAKPLLDQLKREMGGGGMESLKWIDPAIVANMIKNEHPQIIALILVHFDPERAAEVLLHLPDERSRGEVMLRVATLTKVPQDAVADLEVIINEQMSSTTAGQENMVEGVKLAAEILNQVESKHEATIMEVIGKSSPDLATQIQEKMFVFTDLLELDDRAMQQIVKEISTDVLSSALKGAADDMGDLFFRNMSERAAEMLKEDIETKGPMKVSDVEKAQQEIIKVARQLEQDGKIVRGGKGGDVIV